MSVSVEKKENNMAVLTIEVSAEKFAEAIEKVYQRQKNSITLPGFRKGKAPRKMIEKMLSELLKNYVIVFLEEYHSFLSNSQI